MQVGIIGLGHISDIHIQTFLQNNNVVIGALSDVREGLAKAKANQLNIQKYSTNYHTIIRDPSIDIIDILLPHYLHADCVIEALEHGKQVICEKPLATTLVDIDRIARVVKKTGKQVHVKHYFRYPRLHVLVKELIRSNTLGRIYASHCFYATDSIDAFNDPHSWKGAMHKAGGGVLIDSGFHMIDFLHFIFDSPVSIYSTIKKNFTSLSSKGEDLAITILEYRRKVVANILCTSADSSLGFRWQRYFLGSKGALFVEDFGREKMRLTLWINSRIVRSVDDYNWWNNANSMALNDCLERIQHALPPAVSLEESKSVLMTIIQAYKSSQNGKKIRLNM